MTAAGDGNDGVADDSARGDDRRRPESLTPGELLRREREKRSMTQLHIAEELHLDVRIVDAIEGNRFEELGVPVYARGHLRQYAALVGLSPQLIIERYEAQVGQQDVPAPIPASVAVATSLGMERRSLAGPLWMGVALIAAMLGWWIWTTVSVPGDPMQELLNEEFAAEAETNSDELPAPLQPDSALPPAVQAQPPANAPVASSPAPGSSTASSPVTSAPASAATSVAEAVRVRLEFSDASWTEIYDAMGKRLMFGLGESGRVRTISGTPPLRITLGNASAVTVQVNDRPVVVPRQAGRDSTRFQIAAGGVVQMTSGEVPVE